MLVCAAKLFACVVKLFSVFGLPSSLLVLSSSSLCLVFKLFACVVKLFSVFGLPSSLLVLSRSSLCWCCQALLFACVVKLFCLLVLSSSLCCQALLFTGVAKVDADTIIKSTSYKASIVEGFIDDAVGVFSHANEQILITYDENCCVQLELEILISQCDFC